MNKVDYDKTYFNISNLYSTKYDNLFKNEIKNRGKNYYSLNKVTNFLKTKNKISAIVKGTEDYNVSVEYLKNDEIKVNCECKYHNETEPYCKHIYALILTLKMIYEKEKMINIYKINDKKIKNIVDEINIIIIENKKYLDGLIYSWGIGLKDYYGKYLIEMNSKFDKNNDHRLIGLVHDSYYHLNHIIEDYNKIIEYIEEGKKDFEKRKNEKPDVISHTIVFDDTKIIADLDETLANVDISILEKVRQDDIKNGESTEIIDKAIAERKRRDKQIEKHQNFERKLYRRAAFFGLLSGLFEGLTNSKSKSSFDTSYLMPWEKDLVDKGEYEPWNFEEEDLEEEDYYYEDLD